MHARKSHQGIMSVGPIADAIARPCVPATRCLSSILLVLYLTEISATFPARQRDGNFRRYENQVKHDTPCIGADFLLVFLVLFSLRAECS